MTLGLDKSWSLVVSVPPAEQPVTYAEAKEHLRVDTDVEIDTINGLIRAATSWCERFTRRSFITQTLVLRLDEWPMLRSVPYFIELPRPPLISVASVSYLGPDNQLQVWASSDYVVDTARTPGRIVLAHDKTLPQSLYGSVNAVTVTYTAGYGARAAVPEPIKQAIKLLVAHWFENREATAGGGLDKGVEYGVQSLLWPYKVKRFV